jgi:uncharacterized secreted protein with C-terminal beta-propeller domain
MKLLKGKRLVVALLLIVILGIAIVFLLLSGFLKKDNINLATVNHPSSYKDLYNLIKSKTSFYRNDYAEGAKSDAIDTDYSNTNVQVAGVDEADIVKTDGEYIYSIKGEYIYIVKTDNGNMELMSKIKTDSNDDISSSYIEMYINGNKLIAIKNKYSNTYYGSKEIMIDAYWNRSGDVSIDIFDITDKKNPVKENELSQSGYYLSSRMVDGYVYVLTNYYVYSDIILNDEKTYVPSLTTDKTRPIAIDDILIAPNPTSSSYLTVTGIDINNSSKFASSKAILGSSSNIYADLDNLYIAGYTGETINNTYVSKTSLLKFSMGKGIINLEATGTVNGYILNQFSMDEYNGYFRIVTTSDEYTYYEDKDSVSIGIDTNTTKNNLYVLDDNLKVVGKIEGLAKGERIYSVRFDGDIGYLVTFRQVDPLFAIDLSIPTNPVIKSQLKIPGFSEYLHVYNDKYLFGLGKAANEEGRVTGLKISMFNIENKTNITESYKTSVGDEYSWSDSSYNHKSILVSNTKSLIAFPVDDYYVVYRFDDTKGFEKIGQINFELSDGLYYYYGNIRGLYINNFLYVINQSYIKTFNLNTLQLGSSLELK